MLVNFLILFQLIFFEDYKNLNEEYLKNKERCNFLQKKLEEIGKEVDYFTKKKDFLKVKKLLKENHTISVEYTNCKKLQKLQEKKLENFLPMAREEIENEIEKTLSLKISSKEKVEILFGLIEKLKLLGTENLCPIFSFKGIEIDEKDMGEALIEKLNILKSILDDVKEFKERANNKILQLKKEKVLRENLWNFLKKIETEGGVLLDTRISSSDISSEFKRIEEEIESCENAVNVYKSIIHYWEGLLNDYKDKLSKEREK